MGSTFRKLLLLICFFFGVTKTTCFEHLDKIRPTASAEDQAQAVIGLINRLTPDRANEFSVRVNPSGQENGYFEISRGYNGRVGIIASTGVLAAWGFNYYLTNICNCHVSWDGDQLKLPKILPEVKIRIVSLDKFRYYQNVCTVSYSSAWWKWPRWEREIDWMALNGINLPLAFTGQEAIWKRVYTNLGLEQHEIDEHFAGPAFHAWQRMGNLRGWGGPLSDNWHHATLELQHRILDRMRSFGMIPVLPAFAGHVPRAIQRIYPNASLTQLTPWLDFEEEYCCPFFLQPTDGLFFKIGSMFLTEVIKEFGTDHVYNCDVFNEMRPQESDPAYLSRVGISVFYSMKTVDPDAIWVMQGWLFSNDVEFWTPERSSALLTSVPIGRMLVLDLQAEVAPQYLRTMSFYGQPFIYCLLHNFGGTLGMYGVLPTLAKSVLAARRFPGSSMVGTGLTMEGIDQNYVVYDLMLELGWRNETVELLDWVGNYSGRRYGAESLSAVMGWRTLMRSVYNASSDVFYRGRYTILSRRPSLKFKPSPAAWYDPQDVILAWDYFMLASSEPEFNVTTLATFQHDLIDVTRQSIQEMFNVYYSILVTSYQTKNLQSLIDAGGRMIELLRDLDNVLKTGHKFLLGKWLEDAKFWGITKEETVQYEWNARNQITLWGPNGEIIDYAIKQWSGVVKDYILPRWKFFINELGYALGDQREFNFTSFKIEVFSDIEMPFTLSTKLYEPYPTGNAIAACTSAYEKWRPMIRDTIDSLSAKARNHWLRFRAPGSRKPKKDRHGTKRVRLTSG